MTGRVPIILIVGLLLSACGASPRVETAGREMFLRHCASCHGETGKGDGPLAGELTAAPADLTRIAARNASAACACDCGVVDGTERAAVDGRPP